MGFFHIYMGIVGAGGTPVVGTYSVFSSPVFSGRVFN